MSRVPSTVISDLDPLIGAGSIVLIGEIHGTVEFPTLVEVLVEHAVGRGLAVIVGLELPMTEKPNGGTFGSFWHRSAEYRDGRSSQAMANLVRTLAPNDDVQLVAMDGPWAAPGSPLPLEMMAELERPRDETMAQRLLDVMDRSPKAFTIVLAGPMHTRAAGAPGPTLGSILRAWHPRMVALMGQASSGEAWLLRRDQNESGPHPIAELDVAPGAIWAPEPGVADGHHGVLNIGRVCASPPFEDV